MVHCKLCFLLAWVIGSLWMPLALAQQPAGLLDARTRLLEAETRQAIAEAERAELLARLPPAQAKPLPGAIVTRQFGAAGLARAFDLALELAAMEDAARAQLKSVDAFVDSLKAGEASDKSPLYVAARYLGQAERSQGALVLDVDLRLEGMTVVRDNLFTGQKLALSGVAFLWYRLHEADGRLVKADALRRITRPVEVRLSGERAGDGFWAAPPPGR